MFKKKSMYGDDNFIHKYYTPLFLSKNHAYVSSGPEYDSAKRTVRHHKYIILDLLSKKSKSFEWQISFDIFVIIKKEIITTYASD